MLKKPLLPESRYCPASALAALILAGAVAFSLSQHHPEAKGVQPQQQSKYAPEAQQKASLTSAGSGQGGRNENAGSDEGTEYWPPFFGYRLKITDSLLALFTFLLVCIGRKQNALADRQHFLIHRPHLVVRNVRAIGDVGDRITITFEVINVGGSDATIIASAFEAYITSFSYAENPPTVVGSPPKNFIGPRVLIPNAVWREAPYVSRLRWRTEHFHDPGVPHQGFFWGGKILYRDENGKNCRLGVLRRLDVGTRRFRDLDMTDTDYVYDD